MTRKLSSKGFAPVFIIGALLIAVTLGAGCYFVWQHSKKNDTSSHTTSSASQSTQGKSGSSTSQTAGPSDGSKYLYIKEWGVRFLLPEDLRSDITTYVSDASNSGTVLFTSAKLNAATGDGSCNFIQQPTGGYAGGLDARLNRVNPKTYPAADLAYYRSQGVYVTTVGGYEYYYDKSEKNPPITCTTENHSDLNDTEAHISDELTTAFKSIEVVQN